MTYVTVNAEFSYLFQGNCVIPGTSKLHMKPDAIPVINPPRRISKASRNRVKDELYRMDFFLDYIKGYK